MNIEDEYKMLMGAYKGIEGLDEYILKEYALRDIRKYIDNFLDKNRIKNINEINEIVDKEPYITKLQDSLLLLNRINYKIDLILLVQNKIRDVKHGK